MQILEAGAITEVYPVEEGALTALGGVELTYRAEIPTTPPFSTSTLISELWGKNAPDMNRIFYCESRNRQWDDKGKIMSSHTADVGYAQIHVPIWGEKAKELGYNIYETEGNLRMARYIWEQQGRSAWVCSKLI